MVQYVAARLGGALTALRAWPGLSAVCRPDRGNSPLLVCFLHFQAHCTGRHHEHLRCTAPLAARQPDHGHAAARRQVAPAIHESGRRNAPRSQRPAQPRAIHQRTVHRIARSAIRAAPRGGRRPSVHPPRSRAGRPDRPAADRRLRGDAAGQPPRHPVAAGNSPARPAAAHQQGRSPAGADRNHPHAGTRPGPRDQEPAGRHSRRGAIAGPRAARR